MEKKESKKAIYKYIFWFRYIALLGESIFYLINSKQSIEIRIFLLGMLFFLAVVMNYLYRENEYIPMRMAILAILETFGNSVFVVVSGGIFNPYIWYVLNTMFVTAICFKEQYIYLNGISYIVMIIIVSSSIPMHDYLSAINRMIVFNTFFTIVCGMGMIHLLVKRTNELERRKEELLNSNRALEQSKLETQEALKCVMQTYEMLTLSAVYTSSKEIWMVTFDYIIEVLKVPKVMFIEKKISDRREKCYWRNMNEEERLMLIQYCKQRGKEPKGHLKTEKINDTYLMIPICYANEYFGMLFVQVEEMNSGLRFVKELCALTLNNLRIEELNHALLVNEEQNRIANEIHDGALQQLFGVECHLYTLSKQVGTLETEALKEQLEENRKAIQHIMAEIREIIYGMSWNKQGENYFITKLQSYIERMETLYHAQIELEIRGDIEFVSIKSEIVLYRIICESVANSLKHGQIDKVQIELEIGKAQVELEIKDRGVGFDYKLAEENQDFGLGIKNMKHLAWSLGGDCYVKTDIGTGTTISVTLPI